MFDGEHVPGSLPPNDQQDHEEEGQNGGVDEETAFAQEAMDEEAEEATQAYFLQGVNEGEAELEVLLRAIMTDSNVC